MINTPTLMLYNLYLHDPGSPCLLPDVVQAEGLNATFFCQLSTSGTMEWQINEISFRNVNNSGITNQGRGEGTEVLIIHALPELNKTGVVCVLYTIDENGTVTIIESTLATLTVQGWSHIF